MLPQYMLLSLVTACTAVPLNINLGAYSPALVVGDGEISLGSTESASELMATLASGAAANQNAAAEAQQQGEAAATEPPAEEPAAKRAPNLRAIESRAKRDLAADERLLAVENAMKWIKRDLQGFNAALTYARDAMLNTPKIELGTEHAGIGILVNAGANVPVDSAANGAKAPGAEKRRRSEVLEEAEEAPKMTLVAITEV
ncbi:hypothetical protein M011DRAFT_400094 [Sporormia fimetaria CBS 119925]|uniref:Uncharacterized protein n=1 Tax=Sporormia fimetaria CBS 119925 TaxID=1340428 RepID=A0A6A6VG81_9PLEO|nr:hypothetical protein M011DRAFT_400094 [Sporormia fimetaria CBS 119925]